MPLGKMLTKTRSSIFAAVATGTTASNPPLRRWLGLETEYGLVRPEGAADAPLPEHWFEKLLAALADRVPIAPSARNPHQYFLANGGGVAWEPPPDGSSQSGLLESATAETRSPLAAVTAQAALEQLLGESLLRVEGLAGASLLKSSGDSSLHVWGQQENYQVRIATGWRLLIWRLGLLCLLLPLLTYQLLAKLWLTVLAWCERSSAESAAGDGLDPSSPWRRHRLLQAAAGLRLLHAPLAAAFWWLVWSVALIPHRRHLIPFLVSRIVVDGAGHIDQQGRFWLSRRAAHTTSCLGFGRYWGERPILAVGHWLQGLLSQPFYSRSGWLGLWRAEQRLSINLGDASPNHTLEFWRLGATSLMLDVIESKQPPKTLPGMRQPLLALRRFARDWLLVGQHRERGRRPQSALDLQEFYLELVQRWLTQQASVPSEAEQVLQLWRKWLPALRSYQRTGGIGLSLVGCNDWLTKRWLFQQAEPAEGSAAIFKCDVRYHELSPWGYFRQLERALARPKMLDPRRVAEARNLAPSAGPARRRGYFIREFAGQTTGLRVDWNSLWWSEGDVVKQLRLEYDV
jgi:Pup amidohydrolase